MTIRDRKRWTLAVLMAAAGAAHAQVTPSEPFGGRPFGSPPGTPTVQQQRQEQLLQQQQATMGAAAPTVVQVAPPPPPPPAPPTSVGPGSAMQASRTTGQLPGSAPPPAQVMPAAPPSQPVQPPAAAAPSPGTMSPPFANRNAPPGAPAAGMPAAGASAAAAAQAPVRGLPGDAPKLVITGSVFSPNPKQRFLIVNGQPFREGSDLGEGVVLEQVHKESAVLGFKGTRYNVMF